MTPHFTLDELTRTSQPYLNEPPADVVERLEVLASTVLEPAREIMGPLAVSSGYRSPQVNAAVGGDKDSAHLYGRAADVQPVAMSCEQAMEKLAASSVPFDKAIWETRGHTHWIHLQIRASGAQRRMLLRSPRAGVYETWRSAA